MIVWLPQISDNCVTCACNNLPTLKRNQKPENIPPNKERPNKPRPATTIPANDGDENTKKQVRELDLGVVVDHGVRVQEGERGHD